VSLRGGPSVLLGDDRAVLERAGSHQAADGGLIDGEAPGEIGLRFALCDPLQRLGALMGRELARPAEADAALLGALAALARPGADQVALELGQATEDGEQERQTVEVGDDQNVAGQEKPATRAISDSPAVRSAYKERETLPVASDEKKGAVDCTAAQEVAVPLLASAMGNIVTASGPRARLRSGGNSARC
jgi:hypothetical protein